jgi:hypothetical protein
MARYVSVTTIVALLAAALGRKIAGVELDVNFDGAADHLVSR